MDTSGPPDMHRNPFSYIGGTLERCLQESCYHGAPIKAAARGIQLTQTALDISYHGKLKAGISHLSLPVIFFFFFCLGGGRRGEGRGAHQ